VTAARASLSRPVNAYLQRTLEEGERLRELSARIGLVEDRPATHRKVDRVRVVGSRDLSVATLLIGQFEIEPPRQSAGDEVLQLHRSGPVALEAVQPDRGAGLRADQQLADTDL
jgi:hypothetical protein